MSDFRFARSVVAALWVAAAVPAVAAPAAPAPAFKGVFVPVHYTEDIGFTDVFFVTPEIGWVAGEHGTILKTTDGGGTWTAQLGGDPESPDEAVRELFFLDELHGWAMRGKPSLVDILRTTDGGENWIPVGELSNHYDRFAFVSETVGVVLYDQKILRTIDGGKTWNPVFECRAKVDVEGLSRTVKCELWRLSFASAQVGYASGGSYEAEVGIVAKTVDAGATWQVHNAAYQVGASHDKSDISFLDENTGCARFGYSDTGKLFRTTDGGSTWTGVAASPGWVMRFADPEIGWSLHEKKLSFTTDGGKRWTSRSITFPATPAAFSFPRRDTAYVVGAHGMIFRYRVVPAAEPTPAKWLAAPAMPSMARAVLGEMARFESDLAEIDTGIEEAAEAGNETGWAETPLPGEIAELQATADSIATGVPELGRRHRSLNMVVLGLQLLSGLSNEGRSLKQSFAALRQARDPGSAATALAEVRSHLESMKSGIAAALQERSAVIESTGQAVSGGIENLETGDETALAAAPSPAASAARKTLKNKIKKFNPF